MEIFKTSDLNPKKCFSLLYIPLSSCMHYGIAPPSPFIYTYIVYIGNEERSCFFHLVPFSAALLVDTADRPGTMMDTSIMASSECYSLAATPPLLSHCRRGKWCFLWFWFGKVTAGIIVCRNQKRKTTWS